MVYLLMVIFFIITQDLKKAMAVTLKEDPLVDK